MGIVFTRNCYVPGIKRTDGTAMGVAKIRVTEDQLPDEKKLFSDPYAREFVIGASLMGLVEPEQIIKKWDGVLAGMYPMVAGRTRWLDDLVRKGLLGSHPGEMLCEQVIILGAGYDTRGIRLKEITDKRIPVFEVDQPEMHDLKKYGYKVLKKQVQEDLGLGLTRSDEEAEERGDGRITSIKGCKNAVQACLHPASAAAANSTEASEGGSSMTSASSALDSAPNPFLQKADDPNDPYSHLHLVSVDFNSESLDKLAAHPKFKKGLKSVIILEGVTQYIPAASTASTLYKLKDLVARGSILGVSYVDEATFGSDEDIKSKICSDPTLIKKLMKALPSNEPWVQGWSNQTQLSESGYTVE